MSSWLFALRMAAEYREHRALPLLMARVIVGSTLLVLVLVLALVVVVLLLLLEASAEPEDVAAGAAPLFLRLNLVLRLYKLDEYLDDGRCRPLHSGDASLSASPSPNLCLDQQVATDMLCVVVAVACCVMVGGCCLSIADDMFWWWSTSSLFS